MTTMSRNAVRQTTPLSSRELETVTLASQGSTDKQIAAAMGVQLATVRTYWDRIRLKTEASNRSQAIAAVLAMEQSSASSALAQLEALVAANVGAIVIRSDLSLVDCSENLRQGETLLQFTMFWNHVSFGHVDLLSHHTRVASQRGISETFDIFPSGNDAGRNRWRCTCIHLKADARLALLVAISPLAVAAVNLEQT